MRYVLLLVLFALCPRVAAQTLGVPFFYRPVERGVGAALDVGYNDAGVWTLAGTGILALGHVTADSMRLALFDLSGSIATLSGPHGDGSAVGAGVSLLGSFGVGIDRSTLGGVTRFHIPLAAALPLVACASSKQLLELYAVPVWNFERVDRSTTSYWRPSWGSLAIGVLLESNSGLGLELGVGGLTQRADSDPYHHLVIGAGLHFSPPSIRKPAPSSQSPDNRRRCAFVLG